MATLIPSLGAAHFDARGELRLAERLKNNQVPELNNQVPELNSLGALSHLGRVSNQVPESNSLGAL